MPTLETETDYYALLGVDPGADSLTIRKAVVSEQRRSGARHNSPELATRQEAERVAQLLTEVRDVLLDPARRALYDIQRVEALPTWSASQPATSVRSIWSRPAKSARSIWPRPTTSVRGAWPWPTTSVWGAWSRPTVALMLALAMVVFLATRAGTGTRAADSAIAVEMPQAASARVQTPANASAPILASTSAQLPASASVQLPASASVQTAAPAALEEALVAPAAPARVMPTQPPAPTAPRLAIVSRTLPDEVPVTLSGQPLFTSLIPPPSEPFSLAGGRYTLAWAVAGRQPCDFVITIADPITPALARTTLSNRIQNRADGQPAQGQTSVTLNGGKYRLEAWSDTCEWRLTMRAG